MGIIVEDGTGLANANSYAAVAFADSYFSDRLKADWTGSNSLKEAHLILATDYMERRFSDLYMGDKKTASQPLSWPRTDADYDDQVPSKIMIACVEYARLSLIGTLSPDITYSAPGVVMLTTKEKVGDLEVEYKEASGSSISTVQSHPLIDSLLAPFLYSMSSRVIR